MELPEKLVVAGFILVILGAAILGLIGLSDGNGFFFVFPFLFFGNMSGSMLLPFIAILILNLVIFGVFLFWSRRLLGREQKEEYALLIEGECEFCGAPIPKGSTYCPACGKSIREKDERTS
ncbi:MAG: zinc ribbon domain-containing protein [Candidatus Thorarchaeota archaeon]|nr:zinc ribbon domain-containing protein [Candidatus Thorarchaeota archaeon]